METTLQQIIELLEIDKVNKDVDSYLLHLKELELYLKKQ
jgi:hypothetical protein